MNKKITSSALAALMVAGSTSFTAFASMASGTVVIGNKAFDINYVNDTKNVTEITNAILAGGTIYVKNFNGDWIDNISGAKVAASVIPAVTYKGIDKKEVPFAAGDMDVVVATVSVTSISKTNVKVTFPALTVANPLFTVNVLDNNGVKVMVTPVSLEIGETEATLTFTTPLSADPIGIWNVGGVQYNNDAIKNFNDIVTAAAGTNQITLLNALNKAGIKNINADQIVNYATDITASTTKENLANIQAIVDKTNATGITSVEATAAVKAVNDATNQIQLLAALQNKAFTLVNADWIVSYDSAIGIANTTVAGIQTLINNANISAIAATVPTTVATQNALTALISQYTIADVAPATTKANAIKASTLQSALFGVKEATTAASIYNALVKVSALDSTTLPATALNANLKAEYFVKQVGATFTSVATVRASIVTAADLTALNAALTAIDAIVDTTTPTTTTVVKANLQKLADVTSHLGTAKFDMTKVVDASLPNYRTAIAAIGTPTLLNVQAAIASVNGVANQAINLATLKDSSKTVAQVSDALVEISATASPSTTSTAVYLNASSQVKLEVAQFVIDNRANLATGPAFTVGTVTTYSTTPTYLANALAKATADHATQLALFNSIGNLNGATITSTNTALEAYEYAAFMALTTSQKLAVSEQINKLTKSVTVSGVTTVSQLNFNTTDAVTTLAQANAYLDAAIAKVK